MKPPYFMAAYAVQEMTLEFPPPDRLRSDTAAAVRDYGGSTDVLPEGGAYGRFVQERAVLAPLDADTLASPRHAKDSAWPLRQRPPRRCSTARWTS